MKSHFQASNSLLRQQLMDTEDLKNSLEQQVENYKRRLNNQVTGRVSVFMGIRRAVDIKFDPIKDYLVYLSSVDRPVLNCIHCHVYIESVDQ